MLSIPQPVGPAVDSWPPLPSLQTLTMLLDQLLIARPTNISKQQGPRPDGAVQLWVRLCETYLPGVPPAFSVQQVRDGEVSPYEVNKQRGHPDFNHRCVICYLAGQHVDKGRRGPGPGIRLHCCGGACQPGMERLGHGGRSVGQRGWLEASS